MIYHVYCGSILCSSSHTNILKLMKRELYPEDSSSSGCLHFDACPLGNLSLRAGMSSSISSTSVFVISTTILILWDVSSRRFAPSLQLTGAPPSECPPCQCLICTAEVRCLLIDRHRCAPQSTKSWRGLRPLHIAGRYRDSTLFL